MNNKLHYSNFDRANFFFPFYNQNYVKMMYALMDEMDNNRDKMIIQNSEISGTYGCFNGAIWNGGATLENNLKWEYDYINDFVEAINSDGLVFELTFTNTLLRDEHLDDEYCNRILDIIDNCFGNAVIVASDLLEEYIRKTHPNLDIISSVTKGNTSETFYDNINKDYTKVTSYIHNSMLKYISDKNNENIRNKVEASINSGCGYCKIFNEHMNLTSKINLTEFNKDTDHLDCYREHDYDELEELSTLSQDELVISEIEALYNIGIKNYKIYGRNDSNIIWLLNGACRHIFNADNQEKIANKLAKQLGIKE